MYPDGQTFWHHVWKRWPPLRMGLVGQLVCTILVNPPVMTIFTLCISVRTSIPSEFSKSSETKQTWPPAEIVGWPHGSMTTTTLSLLFTGHFTDVCHLGQNSNKEWWCQSLQEHQIRFRRGESYFSYHLSRVSHGQLDRWDGHLGKVNTWNRFCIVRTNYLDVKTWCSTKVQGILVVFDITRTQTFDVR